MPRNLPRPSGRSLRSRPLALLVATFLSFLAGGCGGGGGGTGAPPGPPGSATAAIVFPAHGGLTSAQKLEVRGTAQGAIGVSVAGVAATSSDGFATWQASVPLALGTNDLDVLVTDASGLQSPGQGAEVVRRAWLLDVPVDMTSDPSNARLFLLEDEPNVVVRVDLATSEGSPIAGFSVGSGEPWVSIEAIEYDAAGDRLLAFGSTGSTLLAIDPSTLVRTVVTKFGMASGPMLPPVTALSVDPAQKVVFASTLNGEIYGVALDTGIRWLHSGPGVGGGPALGAVRDLEIDVAGGRLLAACNGVGTEGLYAIDLASGNRTLISGQGVGTGTGFITPGGLVLDAPGARCIVAQNSFPAWLLSVDLATGDRKDFDLATDPRLTSASILAPNGSAGTFFVHDATAMRVRTVTLDDGKVAEAWDGSRGSGLLPADTRGMAALPGGTHAVLVDQYDGGALLFVDLATGDRTRLPGSGAQVSGASNLVLQPSQDRALITGHAPAASSLVAVDLATGARTVLSGGMFGSGPAMLFPTCITLDEAGGRVFVSDNTVMAVLAIDLATGTRSIVSDAATGGGPLPTFWRSVTFDAAGQRVLLAGIVGGFDALLAVDPVTGQRTLLCDASQPGTDMMLPGAVVAADGSGLEGIGWQDTVHVDLTTFVRTVTAPSQFATSPRFYELRDIDRLPDGVALATDGFRPFLYEIDLVTGERIFISR
jgi:hypothetical protein